MSDEYVIDDMLFDEELPVATKDEPWEIQSLDDANFAMNRVARAQSKIDERQQIAESYRQKLEARLTEWLESASKEDQSTIDFFTPHLEFWGSREIAKQHKKKSIDLMDGKIQQRTTQGSVIIYDEDAAMKYCEKHVPDAVKIKKSLSKTELKKALQDGEVIPKVEISDPSTKTTIAPTKMDVGLIAGPQKKVK